MGWGTTHRGLFPAASALPLAPSTTPPTRLSASRDRHRSAEELGEDLLLPQPPQADATLFLPCACPPETWMTQEKNEGECGDLR